MPKGKGSASYTAPPVGQKFGRLTVIGEVYHAPTQNYRWECRCDCGRVVVTRKQGLQNGHARSCGCLHRENVGRMSRRHGQHSKPAYVSWYNMIQRCTNPKINNWHRYGGRGITVCDQWKSFANFYADMGDRPHGHSIERIDNNKGYFPENCKWATRKEQMQNTKHSRLNQPENVMDARWAVELNGIRSRPFEKATEAAKWAVETWPDVPEATLADNYEDDTPGWLVVAILPPDLAVM